MHTKIGIVGVGTIASNVHIPVLRNTPGVEIAWICDANEKRAHELGRAIKVKSLGPTRAQDLPHADIVLLSIPLAPRDDYYATLHDRGIALFAEKPLAVSAAQHRQLMEIYGDWRLSVGYLRRFSAANRLLKSIIETKSLGGLREIHIGEGGRVTRWGPHNYQDEPVARGGGVVRNLGTHSLDAAFTIAGARAFHVEDAFVDWDDETDRQGRAKLTLTLDDGATCLMDWSVSWIADQTNQMEFVFDNARVIAPVVMTDRLQLLSSKGDKLGEISAPPALGATSVAQAGFLEWRAALAALETRSASEISARSCLLTAEAMDKILERSS